MTLFHLALKKYIQTEDYLSKNILNYFGLPLLNCDKQNSPLTQPKRAVLKNPKQPKGLQPEGSPQIMLIRSRNPRKTAAPTLPG